MTGHLDCRAVGHRIGEGHAQLDDVCTRCRQGLHDVQRGFVIRITTHEIGDEGRPVFRLQRREALFHTRGHCSFTPKPSILPTVKMSLSPRPDRFIRMISSLPIFGARLMTSAIAWLGSSAGMIPSTRVRSWNASSASWSMIGTYSARPISFSQECSGPMPG